MKYTITRKHYKQFLIKLKEHPENCSLTWIMQLSIFIELTDDGVADFVADDEKLISLVFSSLQIFVFDVKPYLKASDNFFFLMSLLLW